MKNYRDKINFSTRENIGYIDISLSYFNYENYVLSFFLDYIKKLSLKFRLNIVNFYSNLNYDRLFFKKETVEEINRFGFLINLYNEDNFDLSKKINNTLKSHDYFLYILNPLNNQFIRIEINNLSDDDGLDLVYKISQNKDLYFIDSIKINDKNLKIIQVLLSGAGFLFFLFNLCEKVKIFNLFVSKKNEENFQKKSVIFFIYNVIKFVEFFNKTDILNNLNLDARRNLCNDLGQIDYKTLIDNTLQKCSKNNENNFIENNEIKNIKDEYIFGSFFRIKIDLINMIKISDFVSFIKTEVNNSEIILIDILNDLDIEIYPNELFWSESFSKVDCLFYNINNNKIKYEELAIILKKISKNYNIISINFSNG